MYVCLCHGISDKVIKKLAYDQGVTDIRGIRKMTPLGSQCGKCIRPTKELLQEATANSLYKQAC
ncbi:bacterioferritin [Grimontia hollisae]|uniref:Bacterioferritin-associated ferredoxin n=1 Tax=Grimontia hollisae TaxID=673 RepID=A0A377HIB9_GRIHO|nr:(2Fe-2S)-binding protein [Grimontia hollisae]AMG30360.1 bacterioferritin [Grimontia hollisae]MDF2185095.1 (2Fe-2S)-binding protein [Grimontia hollisae]STO42120.1 Bacterioferritin-associated ferredoxin [Grimontia hollisae]STO55988.1 Bacterioferritin-associated ferredoxin [Grimontia hollisae]STQ77691.1 Bacterioferritin-associated ferredoxin [Grimontia hollisae]